MDAKKDQQLGTFAALAEVPGSVPPPHLQHAVIASLQHAIIPVSGNPVPYSDIHIYHTCRQNSNVHGNSHLKIQPSEVTICSGVVV